MLKSRMLKLFRTRQFLRVKTKYSILVFVALLVILPLLVWGLTSQKIELRKRADAPTPTPTDLNVICWQRVIQQADSYMWPDGCRGQILPDQACILVLVPLTTEEKTLYDQWIKNGRPPILGCAPEPTCVPRPRCATEGEIGVNGQLVFCPLDPIKTNAYCPLPTPTPTPGRTATTIDTRMRFAGVSGSEAEGASITLRFTNQLFDAVTSPIRVTHIGGGIYKAVITVPHTMIPAAQGYAISVKGEKHVARKFCEFTGQTSPCVKPSDLTINLPATDTLSLDFTGMPLEPGDLPPQDGVVNTNDFTAIKTLMAKSCSELSANDTYTGDVDYNGCINVRDAFLMKKTLESRYDEF